MFGKKKNNGVKKKNHVASFFKTVFIILVCFIAISFVAVYAYTKAVYTPEKGYTKTPKVTEVLSEMLKDDINVNML